MQSLSFADGAMDSPSFAELGVSEPIVRDLARRGIEEPFPIQVMVVPDGLADPRSVAALLALNASFCSSLRGALFSPAQ